MLSSESAKVVKSNELDARGVCNRYATPEGDAWDGEVFECFVLSHPSELLEYMMWWCAFCF
jgi:hypothetical protein